MAEQRRLITNRGRLLRSQYGRLVAAPVPVFPDPFTTDSIALGGSAVAQIAALAQLADGIALGDGGSANPPGAGITDGLGLGDGAAFGAYTARPTLADALALADGVSSTLTLALLSSNPGPYPRVNYSKAGTQYDNTGKGYFTAAAGTTAFNNITAFSFDLGTTGLTVVDSAMLSDGGGTFGFQGGSNIAVKNGKTVGAAGTVYECSMYVGTSDGGNHTREFRITSV